MTASMLKWSSYLGEGGDEEEGGGGEELHAVDGCFGCGGEAEGGDDDQVR